MQTSVKLLSRLTDEDLRKVYKQFVIDRTPEGLNLLTWDKFVDGFGRDQALMLLAEVVNESLPKHSKGLWVISTLMLIIAILTSIL